MKTLKNKWMLLAINALLAVVVGLVLLLVPQTSLQSLGFLAGLVIFVVGMFLILGTFIYSEGQRRHPMWLLEGVINLALGLILMLKPAWLFEFIIMLGGIWAIVIGIMQLYIALGTKKEELSNKLVLVVSGLLSAGGGVFLFLNPDMTAALIIQIFGAVSVVVGLIMIFFAFNLYRVWRRIEKALAKEEKLRLKAEKEAEKVKQTEADIIEDAKVIE